MRKPIRILHDEYNFYLNRWFYKIKKCLLIVLYSIYSQVLFAKDQCNENETINLNFLKNYYKLCGCVHYL